MTIPADAARLPVLPEWLRRAERYASDPLAAVQALRPVIESEAAKCEETCRLTDPVLHALADSGLLGLLIPREVGGIEADPETYIQVIEELSYADSSLGWVVMATSFGNSAVAGWGGPSLIEAMFEKGEGFICAGQGVPLGTAQKVDKGYVVSGHFQFASGAQIASWFYGPCVLYKKGERVLGPDGAPRLIMPIVPRSQARILQDTWDVVGLRATASYDFEIIEQLVDEDHVMFSEFRSRRGGPIMQVGVSMAHVAWALGVGMRMLDEIKSLAVHKRRPGRSTLIDQRGFQRDFARASGSLMACRAAVRTAFSTWFEAAKAGEPALEVVAQARLIACWATETIAELGRFAYLGAGSDGLRNDPCNRMQRCFRDLCTGATHKHVDDNVLTDCGSVLLGVNEPELVL